LSLIDFKNIKFGNESNVLEGVPFGVKDNVSIKGTISTGGTFILNNYVPNFTATIIKKLVQAGAVPIFKTNLDELAMGGTGLSSRYGEVYNQYDKDRIIGGSSSGSVYVAAKKLVPFSIGTDTGDSIRLPAAYSGTIGFKPT
jgi:aspartyl-tRNA(Asn)/glutamyl-tRNA(Gln) amidotransferase subunit A